MNKDYVPWRRFDNLFSLIISYKGSAMQIPVPKAKKVTGNFYENIKVFIKKLKTKLRKSSPRKRVRCISDFCTTIRLHTNHASWKKIQGTKFPWVCIFIIIKWLSLLWSKKVEWSFSASMRTWVGTSKGMDGY